MIKLGVIGYGKRMHAMVQTFREVEPSLRVSRILDPEPVKVRARLDPLDANVCFVDDVAALLKGGSIDAVAIGTRCHLHAPYAVQIAATALPLFLEKPVAISMDQALALEQAFSHSKCRTVVSFPLRLSPLCEHAGRLIEQGATGRVEHIRAFNHVPYGTCYFDQDGYRNYAITQGLFLQKATHDFDYMMKLVGSRITRVVALAARGRVFGGDRPAGLRCSSCDTAGSCQESPRNRARNASGGTLNDHACLFGRDLGDLVNGMNEDASSALVAFASGAHGVYSQVFFARRDAGARGAVISGYQGTVSFDWHQAALHHVRHHQPISDRAEIRTQASHMGGDIELARNFIDVIQDRADSRAPIQAGLQSVYVCLAAKASVESGGFETVRQLGIA